MIFADLIRAELVRAARAIGAPDSIDPEVERPRDPAHGDLATNVAMLLAKPLGRSPRAIATALIERMQLAACGVRAAEIAGPGFINFRIEPAVLVGRLADVVRANEAYGRSTEGGGERVVVEFVSANPTGPLHVGHGRQAALGDAIAALLETTGWSVSREFYYNDAGAQVENLVASVRARVAERRGGVGVIPEGGYHGEYVAELADRYIEANPDDSLAADAGRVRTFAVDALRREQDLDLQAFGVRFDTYYLESSLYSEGLVDSTVAALERTGKTYERDGALWLATTAYGDDKDRVMRKTDGTYTYFVPDVAYHVTKWRRGFRRAINVQGTDHHSTVTRVRAGLQALGIGIPAAYPEYVLHQLVTVMRAGSELKISKRAGSYVTVRELIDDAGRDSVRYFFLMRRGESPLVFDVDLARTQSDENPVYYVQMAHARMCGIFRVGGIERESFSPDGVPYEALTEPEELDLVAHLLDYPATVQGSASALEPHRITTYLHEAAELAHRWYHKHHVLGNAESITRARLALARAAQIVLRNGLGLIGVAAPERM
jgi:arginyl-tRNA synthetase